MIFVRITNAAQLVGAQLPAAGRLAGSIPVAGEIAEALVDQRVASEIRTALASKGVQAEVRTGATETAPSTRLAIFAAGVAVGAALLWALR